MLIYRRDMSSGLRYVSIWTSFWIFLPQSNNLGDGFDCLGQHGASITNSITTRIFWLETSVPRMRQSARTGTKLAHFWSSTRNPQWHEMKGAGGETVETLRLPTSPQGEHSLAESRHDHWWHLPDVYVGAKIAPGFPIHVGKIRHDKGKCTRF